MEKRKLYITFDKDHTWEIAQNINSSKDKKFQIDWFAFCKQNDEGISYLFDIAVLPKTFEIIKDYEAFSETCTFIHLKSFRDKSSTIKEFEGTFVDALKYIQTEFR